MNELRDKYLKGLYLVSKASGGEWFEFMKAFDAYVVGELIRSTTAPVGEATVALGMNRALLQMSDDFRNIEKLAEKLKAR